MYVKHLVRFCGQHSLAVDTIEDTCCFWIQVKAFIPYWFPLLNLCKSQTTLRLWGIWDVELSESKSTNAQYQKKSLVCWTTLKLSKLYAAVGY